jgi:hypothetical protein
MVGYISFTALLKHQINLVYTNQHIARKILIFIWINGFEYKIEEISHGGTLPCDNESHIPEIEH